MNIHCIQHEIFEAPGAYLDWAKKRSHTISFTKVYEHKDLPESAKNIDLHLPPILIQKKIGFVIKTYNDLIETNQKKISFFFIFFFYILKRY